MIAWLAVGLMVAGLVTSHRDCGSTLDLGLWSAVLVCLLIGGAWPVLIALWGINVGARLAVRLGAVA